jgi:serine phosphatase RsbU (regulator of sigma subunit)/anti-sigma regulatory factor (Ser/Thr protein kinase)
MRCEALPSFFVQFKCNVDASRTPIRRVIAFLETCGFDRNECGTWEVAIQEGVNNAVLHYQPDKDGNPHPIAIEVMVRPDYVEVHVHDHTQGFTWPISPSLPSLISEHGRGVYLIQQLMDDSDYLRGTHSNRLLLRKNRTLVSERNVEEKKWQERVSSLESQLDETDKALGSMQEELFSCYESLSAIFHFGTEIGKFDNINRFADRLLKQLISIMGANCFLFRTCDENGKVMQTYSRSSDSLNLPPLDWNEDASRNFLESKSIVSRKDVFRDTQIERLDSGDPLNVFEAKYIQVHPIIIGGEIVGVLSVGSSESEEPFTSAQTNVMHTFADFLALQLINASRQEERIKFGKISKELEIAHDIQNSLLPSNWPDVEGYTVAGECITSRDVSGDFFDVIHHESDPNKILLVIADVMGKGVPASIFAAIFRSLARSSTELFERPAELMQKLNRSMFQDLSGVDMFITAQIAYCDLGERVMRISNAGHCPLLMSSQNETLPVSPYSPEGLPLGVVKKPEFEELEIEIPQGCRVLMYTDGIVETSTRMVGNELLGQKRLVRWFQDARRIDQKASGFQASLKDLLRVYSRDQLKDDQTFILLVENG